MTGEGEVVATFGNEARVKISKSSACSHDCASCGACSNPSYEITVSNPVGALAGDRVVIESDSSQILKLSFVLYMLPVFVLIVSALVCEAYSLGWYSVLVFAVLTSLWYVLVKLVNKKAVVSHVITKITART